LPDKAQRRNTHRRELCNNEERVLIPLIKDRTRLKQNQSERSHACLKLGANSDSDVALLQRSSQGVTLESTKSKHFAVCTKRTLNFMNDLKIDQPLCKGRLCQRYVSDMFDQCLNLLALSYWRAVQFVFVGRYIPASTLDPGHRQCKQRTTRLLVTLKRT